MSRKKVRDLLETV